MTERRPLVQVAGEVKELPSGDSLPGGGGGSDLAIEEKTASFTAAAGKHYVIRLDVVSGDLYVTLPGSPSAEDKIRFSVITQSASSYRVYFESTASAVNYRAIFADLEDLSLLRIGDALEMQFDATWGWRVFRVSEGMPHHSGRSIVTHAHASASGYRVKSAQPGEYAQGYVPEVFGPIGSCGRVHLTLTGYHEDLQNNSPNRLVLGEDQDIVIPPYYTYSFSIDITAVLPDLSVMTWHLLGCAQNTGAAVYPVGNIDSPVNGFSAGSWNTGTDISPTGPAGDVSYGIEFWTGSSLDSGLENAMRIQLSAFPFGTKVHAIMTVNKLYMPPAGDCSEGSSE